MNVEAILKSAQKMVYQTPRRDRVVSAVEQSKINVTSARVDTVANRVASTPRKRAFVAEVFLNHSRQCRPNRVE